MEGAGEGEAPGVKVRTGVTEGVRVGSKGMVTVAEGVGKISLVGEMTDGLVADGSGCTA